MLSKGMWFLFVFLFQAHALSLAPQLSAEDEKVTKCITEILADTLSKPSPIPATSECMKILREDERVLAMLHHQHLLTELEELAHQENAKHRLGHEGNQDEWGREAEVEEEIKKRGGKPTQQSEAASEKTQEQEGEEKEEEKQERKEYEKMEKTEEKVKEERVTHGNLEAVEEQAKEVMDVDDDDEEEVTRKKKSSSETWSSREYFGHTKKRRLSEPKIRDMMVRGSHEDSRSGLVKRHFRVEDDEAGDSSEEEPKMFHHGGYPGGRHHEDWADEEEEEKRSSPTKRVAEKASDEETAQFEEEGVKVSNAQSHHYGGWKPWQEEEEGEEEKERHGGHHSKLARLDLKKRHQKDEVYWKGRHHETDEEEKGTTRNEVQELEKLEEIERELKRAAEKLRELKRG